MTAKPNTRSSTTRTTTIRLPRAVYENAKEILDTQPDKTKTLSLNDLFVDAIKMYIHLQRRKRIDDAFAGMATDMAYQREALRLAEDFSLSDWEALKTEERYLARENDD
jgi:hypothetical protein